MRLGDIGYKEQKYLKTKHEALMSISEQYDVNFFRPKSEHAKTNRTLILTLAIIWAVGVFGFQILLMIFNQPTPEETFTNFNSSYPSVVDDNNVNDETKIEFAKSLLMVLGKNIAVSDEHKIILKKSFTWVAANLQPDSIRSVFTQDPTDNMNDLVSNSLKLQSAGFDKIMIDLIPSSLVKLEGTTFPEEYKAQLPGIMELYLVHNRSFLTDFNFIGFPFHYWYTAQFLLIMFVLLCVVYAFSIEKANKKYDFVEEP